MKAALKRKWIAALRSGKYKQGASCLRAEDGKKETFCCLGVLADIAKLRWRSSGTRGDRLFWLGKNPDTGDTMLPARFASEHDLGNPAARKSIQLDLATMNDGGMSFKRIANWISANL